MSATCLLPSTPRRTRLTALLLVGALASTGCALRSPSSELARTLERLQPRPAAEATPRPTVAPTPHAPASSEQLLQQGDQALQSGNRSTAVWSYLRANSLDPKDPTPRERLAALHLDEEPDRAAAIYQSLIKDDPRYAAGHLGLGLARLKLGDVEGAHQSLLKSLELDATDPTALSALGVSYDVLGDHALAQANYRSAHDLRPNDWQILNNLGFSLILSGDYAAAADALQQAVRLEPQDDGLQNNLGLALGRLGKYAEALEAFRRAGDEQAAQNNLAYVYALNGERERARHGFEAALSTRGPETATVIENLRAMQSPDVEGERR